LQLQRLKIQRIFKPPPTTGISVMSIGASIGLYDKKPAPRPRWNAIPETVQKEVLDRALKRTDLSPRELACRFTDESLYFVLESSAITGR
jgi:hypothetical protein